MRRLLVSLFLLLALVGAGCGGDDGDDAASRSTTTADDDTAEAADDPGGAADGEEDEPDFSGKDSGDFCDKARAYEKKFAEMGQDEGAFEDDWNELKDAINDLAEDAPSEIRADINLIRDSFDEVTALYEKYDYQFARIPQEEAAALESEEGEAANERVNAYMENVCKIGAGNPDAQAPEDPSAEG